MDLTAARRRRSSPISRTACGRSSRSRRRCCRRRGCSFSTSRSKASTRSPRGRSRSCCTRSSRAAAPCSSPRTSSRSSSACRPTSASSPTAGSWRRDDRRCCARARSGKSTLEELFIELVGGERPRRSRLAVSHAARFFGAFVWLRWRVLRQLARAHGRARHPRAVLGRDREARPDHRAGPADPVEHRLFVLGITAGSASATGSWRSRWSCCGTSCCFAIALTHLRADRPAVARRRQRRPVSARCRFRARRSTWRRWPALSPIRGSLLTVPVLFGVPIGAGRRLAAVIARSDAGGGPALFLLVVLGLTSLASTVIHLLCAIGGAATSSCCSSCSSCR